MFLISEKDWEVKKTAYAGRGIFARREIAPGTVIGDYLGRVIDPETYTETANGLYRMDVTDKIFVLPDPREMGVHLINHSCMPTCEGYPYKGHMLYFALRRIFSGEELTVTYSLDPPEPGHVCFHACACGTPLCKGTWHVPQVYSDRWSRFVQKKQGALYAKRYAHYGEQLSRLPTYPDAIADDPIYDLFGALNKPPVNDMSEQLPSITQIRSRIRQSGKTIHFPRLQSTILGIVNGYILAQ